MIGQGVDPLLINSQVGTVTRGIKDPNDILSEGTSSAKDLYKAFESASAYNKLTPAKKTEFANYMLGEGMPVAGMNEAEVGRNLLSENVLAAIEKGEPIYDISYMRKPLADLFRPQVINDYLTSLPPRELANIRVEDAVRGSLKMRERSDQLENMAERIRTGKPVPDKVFSDGVSEEIIQRLARNSDIRVIGRTSSFQFRGERKAEAARSLRCSHVVDGSVRRSGSRVRVSAHLLEAQPQTTLWSDRFDGSLDDVFAVQDDIAAQREVEVDAIVEQQAADRDQR
jgi:TolB-like protein